MGNYLAAETDERTEQFLLFVLSPACSCHRLTEITAGCQEMSIGDTHLCVGVYHVPAFVITLATGGDHQEFGHLGDEVIDIHTFQGVCDDVVGLVPGDGVGYDGMDAVTAANPVEQARLGLPGSDGVCRDRTSSSVTLESGHPSTNSIAK